MSKDGQCIEEKELNKLHGLNLQKDHSRSVTEGPCHSKETVAQDRACKKGQKGKECATEDAGHIQITTVDRQGVDVMTATGIMEIFKGAGRTEEGIDHHRNGHAVFQRVTDHLYHIAVGSVIGGGGQSV